MSSRRWMPFLRYAVTGGLNTAVHWMIFALLVWLGNPQSISNLCAFPVAVTLSFFLNAQWTFKTRTSIKRYVVMVLTMGRSASFWVPSQMRSHCIRSLQWSGFLP